MKIIAIECTAEELRANRTVMDSVTDVLSNFADSFCRGVSASDIAAAINAAGEELEEEDGE